MLISVRHQERIAPHYRNTTHSAPFPVRNLSSTELRVVPLPGMMQQQNGPELRVTDFDL